MENEQDIPVPEEEGYVPRPWWQVWLARLGVVIIVIFLVLYYLSIARGGQ